MMEAKAVDGVHVCFEYRGLNILTLGLRTVWHSLHRERKSHALFFFVIYDQSLQL